MAARDVVSSVAWGSTSRRRTDSASCSWGCSEVQSYSPSARESTSEYSRSCSDPEDGRIASLRSECSTSTTTFRIRGTRCRRVASLVAIRESSATHTRRRFRGSIRWSMLSRHASTNAAGGGIPGGALRPRAAACWREVRKAGGSRKQSRERSASSAAETRWLSSAERAMLKILCPRGVEERSVEAPCGHTTSIVSSTWRVMRAPASFTLPATPSSMLASACPWWARRSEG
mmetsp:Transcript_43686/g.103813  ORF Transcript_43686/g.103813 Transcript_43686/m.103813 type:complete len:231 (-) Transcript_43686:1975-2667(-)